MHKIFHNSTFKLELDQTTDQRTQKTAQQDNMPIEHKKREGLVLNVQTRQSAKYRSTQQTMSKPSSHK